MQWVLRSPTPALQTAPHRTKILAAARRTEHGPIGVRNTRHPLLGGAFALPRVPLNFIVRVCVRRRNSYASANWARSYSGLFRASSKASLVAIGSDGFKRALAHKILRNTLCKILCIILEIQARKRWQHDFKHVSSGLIKPRSRKADKAHQVINRRCSIY